MPVLRVTCIGDVYLGHPYDYTMQLARYMPYLNADLDRASGERLNNAVQLNSANFGSPPELCLRLGRMRTPRPPISRARTAETFSITKERFRLDWLLSISTRFRCRHSRLGCRLCSANDNPRHGFASAPDARPRRSIAQKRGACRGSGRCGPGDAG
jgi:hypothetical protein